MENLLSKLTIDDLPPSQQDIAAAIGIKSYIKLVRLVSGNSVYICKEDELVRCVRNAEIKKKFNGYNWAELAKEYNLTTRTVRTIVGETYGTHVVDGQISMFDE